MSYAEAMLVLSKDGKVKPRVLLKGMPDNQRMYVCGMDFVREASTELDMNPLDAHEFCCKVMSVNLGDVLPVLEEIQRIEVAYNCR